MKLSKETKIFISGKGGKELRNFFAGKYRLFDSVNRLNRFDDPEKVMREVVSHAKALKMIDEIFGEICEFIETEKREKVENKKKKK